jgi:hypothetical protein
MEMIEQRKRTLRFETSSLLPLRLVLIEAEKDVPARAPKEHDVNEELALKLIAQMKKMTIDSAAFPVMAHTERAQSKRLAQQNSHAVKSNTSSCHGYINLEP